MHGFARTVGEMVPAGVRQRPLFRGWPAADGAVSAKSADIDSFVVALAGSRCKRNGVDIVSQCRPGANKWAGNEARRARRAFPIGGSGRCWISAWNRAHRPFRRLCMMAR